MHVQLVTDFVVQDHISLLSVLKTVVFMNIFCGEKKFQEQIFGNIINVFLVPFHKLYELFLNKRSKH